MKILSLMIRLKDELAMSLLLITHDLGVVAQMATRVVVMYAGQVVEEAGVSDIYDRPFHPYSQGLLKSMPRAGDRPGGDKERLNEIPGIVPVLTEIIEGCKFADRCPHVFELCRQTQPQLVAIRNGHRARCRLREYPERRKQDV